MRVVRKLIIGGAALSLLVGAKLARGDYESHPELAPSVRCEGLEDATSPTGYGIDCQPLFWDLPAATRVGQTEPATPLTGFPDFVGGMTDRPPPLYSDGVDGYELPGLGRTPLCPSPADATLADPDRVPYWKATGLTDPQTGADLFEVACRRGTRATYGPWTVGTDPSVFDKLAYKILVFENSTRLAADGAASEMNVSAEIYDHVASHHGTCFVSTHRCADASNPDANSSECDFFRQIAQACPADGPSTECPQQQSYGFVAFRSTMARQGRYIMDLPSGRAFPVVENPMWLCQQHVVSGEPTVYGQPRDFRKQQDGAVGELVVQFFTERASSSEYEPVSMAFDFVASSATTLIPPYTIAPQDTLWYAPFDLAIGMLTMHSHQNMVKGTIDVVPAALPRPSERSPRCGGPKADGLPNVYENFSYFDPEVCEYWRNEADGPIVLRKGEGIRASCLINNGVRPTQAIADPDVRHAVETSAVGHDLLYGEQPASIYRVRYGCERTLGVPPGTPGSHARDCPPNPATDTNGLPIDGPYTPKPPDCPGCTDYCPTNLGYTGRCVPANAVFSNTGPDAMCIPIIMYWPLERMLDADGSPNDAAVRRVEEGRVNEVGTPGRVWKSPSDGGSCDDGAGTGGTNLDDPKNPLATNGHRCRAGL